MNHLSPNSKKQITDEITHDEIIVDGQIYDISTFKKVHPGGSIITFYAGTDATDVWREFHSRSKIASKRLKSLKSRPSQNHNKDPVIRDLYALRKELEAEGIFEYSLPHIIYRLMELLVLHALGFYLLTNNSPILGIFIWSIANGRCGWAMHECGHGSFTGINKIDKVIQSILFGLGNGMSGDYWNNQHNKHHAAPQKLGQDVDLNTLPLIAFNKIIAKRGNPYWLKYQAILFVPVVTCVVTLYWALYLHPRFMIRRKNIIEIICYVLRWLFVIKYLNLLLFLLNALIGGIYIFVNFALSHTHKPIVKESENPNWVEYAANHTINITPSWWCDWWMGYLNYQIEHHLFPRAPRHSHRRIQQDVRKICARYDIEYAAGGFWSVFGGVLKTIYWKSRDAFMQPYVTVKKFTWGEL